ncbi:thioredoxin family protein [Salisediminibacterium halotolerans]|uniref:Thioredoxin n=1 Tax=Salisediminibacterium halotolerans TaxID=517425 RepID=A0A1H9NYN5_9BACI|nr:MULTISPECIES: thioredoxin family protein [Salisediminibacterium]RLJ77897.1 thioredoxin [Actinophytocola xinjiangensis]RPE88765.1 thioredoxin [Salisediminibacterium halotolerans]TWG36874.1 thioredoxin [Salisediminibacterium halotolerans]SER40927.1 Thioredoxin [Salisediminibacterium haloalkalitolerans]GEL09236.1 thiol reductase thioredoxin [Salisediminibacterium halotolerans]
MKQMSDRNELTDIIYFSSSVLVYFYTPLCGTCDLARQFIEMAETAAADKVEVYEMDINLMKQLVSDYKIESVPCLVRFEGGEAVSRIQAFESVTNVYNFLMNSYARSE